MPVSRLTDRHFYVHMDLTGKEGIKEKVLKPNWLQDFGGDGRDRTVDLLNAIQALSQLSYTPGC